MSIEACLPRERLKQYLIGGADELQTLEIEAHLADCPDCEKTLVELEETPDTLLETLRHPAHLAGSQQPSGSSSSARMTTPVVSSEQPLPAVVQKALQSARNLAPTFHVQGLEDGNVQSTAAESPTKLDTGARQIGAYELLRPLGRGGMGMVVLGRHRQLQKEVAIKLLPWLGFERNDLVARFQREIRAAGRLNHPSIVNSTDAGEEHGTHYLVMEFIDGLDLSRIARIVGPWRIADACEVIRQAALGLAHAHASGVVHRDVKPSNLMLDAEGRVKILDFGLAQIVPWEEPERELTMAGQLMGTLDYMAPEQADREGNVDFRADLYALGATLFRLIAGRPPMATDASLPLSHRLQMLQSQSAPRLSSPLETVPAELIALVESLLARSPENRPATAMDVAKLLEPFCSGSDLKGLLQESRAKSDQGLGSADQPSLLLQSPSLLGASSNPTTMPLASPHDSSSRSTSASSPSSRWPISTWVALALAPLAAIAGFWIVLETQKGELVIQSEVADVHVVVVKDGKKVDELTIHPGAQTTRLRADKYEIKIDQGSDQVVLDKETFSIKKGETVVATITRRVKQVAGKENDHRFSLGTRGALSGRPATNPDAKFDDRTLAQWIDIFNNDLSLEAKMKAIDAFQAIGKNDSERITKLLIEAARKNTPDHSGIAHSLGGGFYSSEASNKGFHASVLRCLTKLHDDVRFDEILFEQLLKGDDQWTALWIRIMAGSINYDSVGKKFAIRLLESKSLASEAGPMTSLNGFLYTLKFLLTDKDFSKAHASNLIEQAAQNPHLGIRSLMWMNYESISRGPLTYPYADGSTYRLEMFGLLPVEESLATLAKKTVIEGTESPLVLALAASRLATTSEVVEGWREELLPALHARMQQAVTNPDRALVILRDDQNENHSSTFQRIPSPMLPSLPSTNYYDTRDKEGRFTKSKQLAFRNSEYLAYLALAQRLSAAEEFSKEIEPVLKWTLESWLKVEGLRRNAGRLPNITPPWPFEPESIALLENENEKKIPQATWFEWGLYTLTAQVASNFSDASSPAVFQLRMGSAKLNFAKMDRDNNGKLNEGEVSFAQFPDLNQDGWVDFDEFFGQELAQVKLVQLFFDADKNRDKKLSPEEWQTIPGMDGSMDADGDGSISFREFLTGK